VDISVVSTTKPGNTQGLSHSRDPRVGAGNISGYVEQLHDVELIKMVVYMDAKALREIPDVGT